MARYGCVFHDDAPVQPRGRLLVTVSQASRNSGGDALASPHGRIGRRLRNPCQKSGPPGRDEWRASRKLVSNADISESLTPPAPHTQRRPSSATLSAASRAKTRLIAASAVASKRRLAFSFSFPSAKSAARRAERRRALGVGNPLSQPQENVLITCQARDARSSPSLRPVREEPVRR